MTPREHEATPMAHVPCPRPSLRLAAHTLFLGPLWLGLGLGLLACGDDSQGDDLPAGAFTSGPGATSNLDTTEDSTSVDPATSSSETTVAVDSGSSEGPPIMLSHDVDIMPIWVERCTDGSCHDADAPQAGLDLASPGTYERLCEGDHNFSGMRYIDCVGFDPENSYAFRKIENTHLEGISGGNGLPMPPTQDMTDQEIETVRAWIEGGALP